VIVDLGCGDGRGAVVLAGSSGPGSLVLAADPVAAAMAETSRRAVKSSPNLVFLEASAEALAAVLPGAADHVVTWFPWGSLLRGVLGRDATVAEALGALVRPGGRLSALVSVTERDQLDGLPLLDGRSARCVRPSPAFELIDACPASAEEVRATRSTWGRRLLAGGAATRPMWRLEWRRCG
jgi:hypothetical protein